jgi:hypothetical protein
MGAALAEQAAWAAGHVSTVTTVFLLFYVIPEAFLGSFGSILA